MPKFIVEMDERGTQTYKYAVEAASRKDAIALVSAGRIGSYSSEFHGDGCVTYDDTHELEPWEEGEWKIAQEVTAE